MELEGSVMDRNRKLAEAQQQILSKQARPETEPVKQEDVKKPEGTELKAKPKKEEKPPAIVKQYFTVKLEVTAPVTLTYRVLAEDAEQALNLVTKSPMTIPMVAPPKPVLGKMKKLKANIYLAGTSLIKLVKIF